VRAIIRQPEMIILDEATSQLDAETEEKIQNALELAMKDKTVIIIAHRLSTLRITDRIFFVDHGKIIEEGDLDELTEKGGRFASLYSDQFSVQL
jgi:ABC-type multidrug transport system fused ATPase/permease subunit